MGKSISVEEMLSHREDGDEFEIMDNGHRSIEGFTELVAELRSLVESQRANAGADMLRSEMQEQVIKVLQKIVSKPAPAADMTPMIEMLADMQGLSDRPRASYEFSIDSDGQGFMQKITARPIPPTTH